MDEKRDALHTSAEPPSAILLRSEDNVAIATRPIARGTTLAVGRQASPVLVGDAIALGHKLAVSEISKGEAIRKYGQIIGFATERIPVGSWVHTHNISAEHFTRDYAHASQTPQSPRSSQARFFDGYLRPDGRVGTRNYVAVISTVNCSASTSRLVAQRFQDPSFRRAHPNIDGVFAVTHKQGCAIPFEGRDHKTLERTLAGFACHPNIAAYILIGLGCEVSYTRHLADSQDLVVIGGSRGEAAGASAYRPFMLNIQETGGITKTVEAAVAAVQQLLPAANDWRRSKQPASKIVLGLECGGSDGNSGVTANPALGVATDLIVAQGGTAILGETPEIYGAEHLLTRRAVSPSVGEKLVERIRWWEWYSAIFGGEINNNPSPGNKQGGLTTIYEKSLGALAKGGASALVDVVDYAETVRTPGLVFMDTPGYDPPCTTGLVAGGANVLVFTTGRGSVLGLKPTPCIKVATNTPMYERLKDDMDVNTGTILEGESVHDAGTRIFERILEVASGGSTASERLGVGEEEFDPWLIGPIL